MIKQHIQIYFFFLIKQIEYTQTIWTAIGGGGSDVTGLGRTRQKPDLDYFFQTETRTRLLRRNPEKPEPDCETRQNPKGFCKD